MHELKGRAALMPLGAAVGVAFGVTVVLITVFNYLIEPMRAELGLSAQELSLAISLHMALLILSLPLAGAVADRIGARRTAILSALLYGLCLMWISRVSASKAELYGAFALAALLGAGASPVTYTRAIVAHFEKARGTALGITLSGVGFASILLPLTISGLIAAEGWRTAVATLAGLVILAGLVGGFAVGDTRTTGGANGALAQAGYSLGEAARTSAFWKIAIAFILFGVSLAGFVTHLSEVWKGLGLSALQVPVFQALIGVGTIVGRLAGGAMMDRWPANKVGALFGLCGAAALALVVFAGTAAPALVLAGLLLGLCLGAESDVASYLVSRYYGLAHFARIYAVQASAFMVGLALGPTLFAVMAPRSGYAPLLLASALGVLASAVVLMSLRPPASANAETRAA